MDHDEPEPGLGEEQSFTLPLPPPPFGAENDVVFFTRRADSETRDHDDVMLRRVPRTVAHRFRGAAGARGLTHAQYLTALVALHETMRRRADAGDADTARELERLGLNTVSI